MLRNREIRILWIAMCLIGGGATIAGALCSSASAILIFVTAALLIGTAVLHTRWRYREIKKLSDYLRRISGGEYALDVRDNKEGELSILKNEIYKVTRTLSEQSARLKQDKVQLTDAISDISHQLKTPLTSIAVMADLLDNPQLSASKRAEFSRNIHKQLERLDWLVSSLLKLAKIDAGTVRFKKDRVRVDMLLQKAMEPLRIPMEIKELAVSIEGENDACFTGDLNWSTEAMINILKNCVEHTPDRGEIRINFSENALYTEIIFRDNGKGIAREDIPYIFKRFYKGKNASDDSIGVGLAMAYSIVTNQNGTIEVQSEVDKGTQFTVKFYKQTI